MQPERAREERRKARERETQQAAMVEEAERHLTEAIGILTHLPSTVAGGGGGGGGDLGGLVGSAGGGVQDLLLGRALLLLMQPLKATGYSDVVM